MNETIDEEVKMISIEVQKAMEEKFKAEQEAIQLKLQQEKLQREQEELAGKTSRRTISKRTTMMNRVRKGKSFVGRTTKKNSRVNR